MTRRITMNDVARRAGVHYTTVSMALRNHPRLPAATRERLRALAEEMGYRPDPVLQALNDYRGRLKPRRQIATIAYVTNFDSRWGWKQVWPDSEFYAGAERRASDLGYQLEHFWLGEPGLSHHRLSDVLHARGITGIVIASHRYEANAPLAFDWTKFCGVKIEAFPQEPALHHVSNDRHSAIRIAVRQVKAAGYRRIGFAMHPLWDLNADLAWSAGFLAEQQLIASEDRVPMFMFPEPTGFSATESHSESSVRESFQTWLTRYQPDCLISTSAFVKTHLDALGISIPRDLAFADILLPQSDGRVAGVRQNSRRVGEVAIEILASQLQQHAFGVPELPNATLIESTWCDGDSLPKRRTSVYPSETGAVLAVGE